MTTHVEQVQRIARAYGYEVDDTAAGAILWEETGFPSFFRSSGVMRHRELRRQIRRYFRNARDDRWADLCVMCASQGCQNCGYTGRVVMEGGRKVGYMQAGVLVRTDTGTAS